MISYEYPLYTVRKESITGNECPETFIKGLPGMLQDIRAAFGIDKGYNRRNLL